MKIIDEASKKRQIQFTLVEELWTKLNPSILIKINSIKSKSQNENAKEYLDYSYQDLNGKIADLKEYSVIGEQRKQFNTFVKDTHSNVFKNLKKSITYELEIPIGEGTPVHQFFLSFFNLLGYKHMKRKFNGNLSVTTILEKEDFFNWVEADKKKEMKRIRKFLEGKSENNPDGYHTILLVLDYIRNICEHRPNCITKDYLYDKVEDYGNFFVASNFIVLLIYGYLEILDRWNKFLY